MRIGTPSLNRKLLIGFVLCILLTVFTFLQQSQTIQANGTHGYTGIASGTPSIGRTGPDLNYNVHIQIPNGSTIITLAQSPDCEWVYVWSDAGNGWIPSSEVTLTVDAGEDLCTLPIWTNPMSNAVWGGNGSVANNSSNSGSYGKLNNNNGVSYVGYTSGQPTPARTTPAWDAPINVNLPDSTFVTIVARNHDCAWVFVRSNVGDGWIPATFVRVTGEGGTNSSDTGSSKDKDANAFNLCDLPVWNTGKAQPQPTPAPTIWPTAAPTIWPTAAPTIWPTAVPTQATNNGPWPTATPRPQGTNNQPTNSGPWPTATARPQGTNGTNNLPPQPQGTNGTNNLPPRPQGTNGTNNLPPKPQGTNNGPWPTATARPQGTNNLPPQPQGTNNLPPKPQGTNNTGGTNRLPTATPGTAVQAPTTGRNIGNPDNWYLGHDPHDKDTYLRDSCLREIPIHTTDRAPSAGKLEFRTSLKPGSMRVDDHLMKTWDIWRGDRLTNDLALMHVAPSRYARLWYYRNDTKTWYLLPSQYWHGNNRAESEYGQDCDEGWTASYHTSFSKAIPISKVKGLAR